MDTINRKERIIVGITTAEEMILIAFLTIKILGMESFFKTIFTYLISLIVLNIIKWDIIFKMYKSYMKENT